MSVMDKFLRAIQLNGDGEEEYYDEPDFDSNSKVDSLGGSAPIGRDDPIIDASVEDKVVKKTPSKPSAPRKKASPARSAPWPAPGRPPRSSSCARAAFPCRRPPRRTPRGSGRRR